MIDSIIKKFPPFLKGDKGGFVIANTLKQSFPLS